MVSEGLVGVLVDGNHAAMVEVCRIIIHEDICIPKRLFWYFGLEKGLGGQIATYLLVIMI